MLPPISRKAHRRALLIPLVLGVIMLMAVFVIAELVRERQSLADTRERTIAAVNEAFGLAIQRDTDTLGAVLKAISSNPQLRASFRSGARDKLYREAKPLFEGLRRDHGITHFYFIRPDREMFLRVQRPASFGDSIQRTTLLQAEQRNTTSSGLELGQKGVFTLRVVEPWRDADGTLIGYIELGKEIDRTLAQLHELTGVELYLLVNKRFLKRDQWIEGMDMIARTEQWDRLPAHVVTGRTRNATDELLSAYPGIEGATARFGAPQQVRVAGRPVEFSAQPLVDVSGRSVGTIVLAHDLSTLESRQQRFIILVITGSILAGAVLLVIGFRLIDKAYASLNFSRELIEALHESGNRDNVTGMLDRDAFADILTQELISAANRSAPCAMLRIAVDDYSRMTADGENDTADKALQVVARQIRKIVRPSDAVGRHEGGEFAVILPGMSAGAAYSVARRIYEGVATAGFSDPNDKRPLTVSIGVAASPIHGENPAELLDAANRALQSARGNETNRVETAKRTPTKRETTEA